MVPEPGRFEQEVAGVSGRPLVAVAVAGPVGEGAVRRLERGQLADGRLDVVLDFALLALVELGQALEIELGEGCRERLLEAAVGILDEEVQPLLEIEGRQGRGLDRDRVGALQAEGHDLPAGRLARSELEAGRLRDESVGGQHGDVDGVLDLLPAARRAETDPAGAEPAGRLEGEGDDAVARLVEGHGLLALADDLEQGVGLDRDGDLLDLGPVDEDRDRHDDVLAGPDDPRQGGQGHEVAPDRDRPLGPAEGAAPAGHDHDPDGPEILRHEELVDAARAGLEVERPLEQDDGREAARLLGLVQGCGVLVAADGQQAGHLGPVGLGHEVEQVPGADAEGLAGVEGLAQVGRREPGQAEQALVDDGQGVGHGPPGRLAHLDLELFRGPQLAGHLDGRVETRGRVLDEERQDAVEPDGRVGRLAAMGLEERDVDIDVGRHGRRERDFDAVLALDGGNPLHVQDRGPGLERDQGASLNGRGQEDDGLLADLISGLVGGQRQRRGPRAALPAGPARPVGPIDVDDLAGGVAAGGVLDADQVPAPGRLADIERPGPGAVPGRDRRLGDRPGPGVGDVLGQRLAAPLPPPPPLDLVQRDDDAVAGHRLAGRVHGRDVDPVVPVRHQQAPFPVAFRDAQTDVGVVGVEGQGEGVDAEVAAGLEDPAGEGRLEQPGAGLLGPDVDAGLGPAAGIEDALGRLDRAALEVAGRIVEGEVGVAVEARGPPRQADRHVVFEVGGRGAVEPLGRHGRFERHVLAPQGLPPGIERDLQPVRHDRLDLERPLEGQAADEDAGPPVARRGRLFGGDAKSVEGLDRPLRSEGPGELALGRVELQGDGMALGQDPVPVEQGEGQVEGVARPPDAALAVEDALDALLRRLAADVEMARGQDALGRDAEVVDVAAALGRDIERPVAELERGEAVAVGCRLAEKPVLVVVGPDLEARERPGRADVGRHDAQGAAGLELGHQADVGGEEVPAGHGRGIEIGEEVGVRAGVLAVAPFVPGQVVALEGVVPVLVAAVALVVHVADRPFGRDRAVRRRAGIGRVAAVHGQDDAEQRARVLREQGGDVEVVAGPLAGHARVVRERHGLAPEVAADPGQLLAPFEAVDLEELGHVAGVDLKGGHLDAAQIDGLERHGQPVLARQDQPPADEADLGPDGLERDLAVEPFGQAAAEGVADAGHHLDVDGARELPGGVEADDVAVDLEGQRPVLGDDEPLELLVLGQGVGETHDDMAGLAEHGLYGQDLELALGRDLDGLAAPVVDADGPAVPLQDHGRGRLAALDAADGEEMDEPAGRMAPVDGQGPPGLFGPQDLLDEDALLVVGGDDPAAQDLGLGPVGVLGEEALDGDLQVRPHDGEAEGEAGEGLGHVEDAADADDGLVVLAGLEPVARGEDELARAAPLGLAGQGRGELDEPGLGRAGHGGVCDEEHPDGRLARDRPRGEGADVAVPLHFGLGRAGGGLGLAAEGAGDGQGQKQAGYGPLGHEMLSPRWR